MNKMFDNNGQLREGGREGLKEGGVYWADERGAPMCIQDYLPLKRSSSFQELYRTFCIGSHCNTPHLSTPLLSQCLCLRGTCLTWNNRDQRLLVQKYASSSHSSCLL